MGKKYLLYIHAEKFEKEKKKSDLVNKLLDEHYNVPITVPGIKSVKDIGKVIEFKKAVPLSVAKEDLKVPTNAFNPIELCKHGAMPELCKFSKIINGKRVCK
jgi:hypothetical protein